MTSETLSNIRFYLSGKSQYCKQSTNSNVDIFLGVYFSQESVYHRDLHYAVFTRMKIYCSDHKSLFHPSTLGFIASWVSVLDYIFYVLKKEKEKDMSLCYIDRYVIVREFAYPLQGKSSLFHWWSFLFSVYACLCLFMPFSVLCNEIKFTMCLEWRNAFCICYIIYLK